MIRAANVSLPSPLLGRGAGGEGESTFDRCLQLSLFPKGARGERSRLRRVSKLDSVASSFKLNESSEAEPQTVAEPLRGSAFLGTGAANSLIASPEEWSAPERLTYVAAPLFENVTQRRQLSELKSPPL